MNDSQKKEIQALLNAYVERFPSQAKAAASLRNVAEATVINIRKGKWESISADMWRNVAKQVGYNAKGTWTVVQTLAYRTLYSFFADAKEYSQVYAITAPAGTGKSKAAESFAKENENVYHITGSEYYNRKVFLSKILEKMGKDNTGSVAEMMDMIVETLLKQEEPIIIIDEADKLKDQILCFFISLYNMLHGKCAIVLMATDHLSKRINKGRRINKQGFSEIYSRIGRKFLTIPETSFEDIAAICNANGITDKNIHTYIYNEYEGDLRRVERAIHRERKKADK